MNTPLSNLLKENSKALQGLHAIADMDFQKPFTIIECTGNFTYNSILNALGKPDLDEVNIFVVYKSFRSWNANYNYLAHVIKGKFETQRDDIEGYESVSGWRWFDTAIGKGTFETERKDKRCHYWIISQERKYAVRSEPKAVDYYVRYRTKIDRGNYYAIPYDKNGDWYYDNVCNLLSKYNFDKSGYTSLVNNYDSRVRKLKAERSAAEAAKFDNTEKLREFTERINHCNEALQIVLAGNYLDIDYEKIYNVAIRLRWIKSRYNDLKLNEFNSVSAIRFTLERLETDISAAEKILKGE
jgi:hypothetical protein